MYVVALYDWKRELVSCLLSLIGSLLSDDNEIFSSLNINK